MGDSPGAEEVNNHFAPASFNSNYGEDSYEIIPTPEGSLNDHLHLSQEETQEGNQAPSLVYNEQHSNAASVGGNEEEDEVFPFAMDDEDLSEEVKSKPILIAKESEPVQVTSDQNSDSGSDCTITSGHSASFENCVPIQEGGTYIYTAK